jgi:hypothetical protein
VTGDIHVRGEIETKIPPNLAKKRDTAEEKKETREKRRFVVEVLTLIFVIIYAGITFFQWRDLRRNFEINERALMKATVQIPPAFTDPLTAAIRFTNVGKSVAERAYSEVLFEVIPRDERPDFGKGKPATTNDMTPTFPEDYHDETVMLHTSDGITAQPMTPTELDSLRNGTAYVAVYGAVIYTDQFGTHWTKFCSSAMYRPGTYTTHWCTAYNHLGEGATVSIKPDD